MTEGNHEKNLNPFGQHRDLNSEFSEYESTVMNFDQRYALFIHRLYHKPHFTVVGVWNNSFTS